MSKLKNFYENNTLIFLLTIIIVSFVAGIKTRDYLHDTKQQSILPQSQAKRVEFDRKKVINISPREVLDTISKEETRIKQQELIKELYAEKFVLWDIKIEDVFAYDDGTAGIWGSDILAKFDNQDAVLPFKKDMVITVAGIISDAGGDSVVLKNSKVIEIK